MEGKEMKEEETEAPNIENDSSCTDEQNCNLIKEDLVTREEIQRKERLRKDFQKTKGRKRQKITNRRRRKLIKEKGRRKYKR